MFTHFADRDGKLQFCALTELAFDPLARTTRFMLMEDAHHMYVGESGVARVIRRTCESDAGAQNRRSPKVRELGVVDLPTIQRYVNFHYSVTLDLFGADVSSNAATFYSTRLKGRYEEKRIQDDHILKDQFYPVLQVAGAECTQRKTT